MIQSRALDTPEENFEKTYSMIEKAVLKGAQVVCTQELFKTRYFCQTEDWKNFQLAETITPDNKTIKNLSSLAKAKKIVIIASLFEKRNRGVYHNTVVVIDTDGNLLGKYRKMHIPDDPHFYEKFYFTPGDIGYKVFKTKYLNIGTLICWDQWFPEAARITALKGADIIFYPTAIGWLPEEKEKYGESQLNAWKTIQKGHAVANGIYIASVNRVGFEASPDGNGGIEFWGQSFVSNPYGEITKKASSNREEIIIEDLNLTLLEETRIYWPFFRDRRIDSYINITKRWIDEE